jgi:hypothetical protein
MNEVISKTNPIPPTGGTNTSVPLGITGSTAETMAPVNVPINPTTIYNAGSGVYLGNFQIKDTDVIGTGVFEWQFRKPLTADYKRTTNANGQHSPFTPWDYVVAYLSKQTKVTYSMEFIPIKIGDCRARLDFVYNFERRDTFFSAAYNTKLLANYNEHKLLDDADQQKLITIPDYFMTNNVTTDVCKTRQNSGGVLSDLDLPNAYVPTTNMKVYIAAPYQHNNMQMPNFNVHIILYAHFSNTYGLTGKRSITVKRPNNEDRTDFLTPYFYLTK